MQNGDYVNSRSDESDERRVSLAPCLRAPRLKLTQRETFHWLPPCLTVYSEQVEASNKHTVLACGNTGWKRYNNIISAAKGYRTVQSGIFVEEGAWYFEVVLAHLGESGHARIGWATQVTERDAPIGVDEHGYAYCDVGGEKVHDARREPYGDSYAAGDVIGCYIFLPPKCCSANTGMIDGNIVSNQNIENHAMSHGSASYAVDAACAENVDKSCTAHSKGEGKRLSSFSEDSFGFVAFAKNGCFQGIAYHLRSRGAFSPSVSLFTHGKVEPATTVAFNFGPDFLAQVQFGDLVSQILCRQSSGHELASGSQM